jgi:hypothetical protein
MLKHAHQSILEHAMQAADPEVGLYAALAVGTYDRRAALDRVARELVRPEQWLRERAAYFPLLFDDARGIPVLIDRLEQDHEAARHLACEDLRLYTQQPLPCVATLLPGERESNIKLWRSWWSTVSDFQPKGRQAMLDRLAIPEVLPVSYKQGFHVAQGGAVPVTSLRQLSLEHR